MAAFAVLVVILGQAAALDIGDALEANVDYWIGHDTNPIIAVLALVGFILLTPGMIYGIAIELTELVNNLSLRVLRRFGWSVNTLEFWSHDSWTWLQLAVTRKDKPLSTAEASCWWLCRHKDGPDIDPHRAALAIGISTREVRNALARAERKLGD
jgi:hypothetical protein